MVRRTRVNVALIRTLPVSIWKIITIRFGTSLIAFIVETIRSVDFVCK
jgi:hypothetical protein